jgi:hypothetical protein
MVGTIETICQESAFKRPYGTQMIPSSRVPSSKTAGLTSNVPPGRAGDAVLCDIHCHGFDRVFTQPAGACRMADAMATLPQIEPGDTGNADRARRWRFQFSLSTLLLFTVIVAIAVASVVMYRRMKRAEEEFEKVRDMAGYLKVEDENLFYAIALECHEPWTWRWRVHLPAGYKYSWNVATRDIPRTGIPRHEGRVENGTPRKKEIDATVVLYLRRDPDGILRLNLQSHCADESPGGITMSVSDETWGQFMKSQVSETERVGANKAESRKLDQPIVFLRYRIGEKQPDGLWSTSQNAVPGIMVWLGAVP